MTRSPPTSTWWYSTISNRNKTWIWISSLWKAIKLFIVTQKPIREKMNIKAKEATGNKQIAHSNRDVWRVKGTWVRQWWALNRACPEPQAQEEPQSCCKKEEEEQFSTGSVDTPPIPIPEAWLRAQIYEQMLISVEKSMSRVSGEHLWCLLAVRALFGHRQVNSFMCMPEMPGLSTVFCGLSWELGSNINTKRKPQD